MPKFTPARYDRIKTGNNINKGLLIDTGPKIRFINLHGNINIAGGILVTVRLLKIITRPHIIRTLQPISTAGGGSDVAIDILISSDTEVDDNAEIRDRHLSGGRLAQDGWAAMQLASPWAINQPQASWWTVYKLAMRNNTGAGVTFDASLTIELF